MLIIYFLSRDVLCCAFNPDHQLFSCGTIEVNLVYVYVFMYVYLYIP